MTHEKLLNEICENHNSKLNDDEKKHGKMLFATYKDPNGNECAGRFSCKEFTTLFKHIGEIDEDFFKGFIIWIFNEIYTKSQ